MGEVQLNLNLWGLSVIVSLTLAAIQRGIGLQSNLIQADYPWGNLVILASFVLMYGQHSPFLGLITSLEIFGPQALKCNDALQQDRHFAWAFCCRHLKPRIFQQVEMMMLWCSLTLRPDLKKSLMVWSRSPIRSCQTNSDQSSFCFAIEEKCLAFPCSFYTPVCSSGTGESFISLWQSKCLGYWHWRDPWQKPSHLLVSMAAPQCLVLALASSPTLSNRPPEAECRRQWLVH